MEDYEAFARTIGALLYNTSHVDIIQLALKEPEESAVYKAALKITSERPQRLFFDWKNRKGARSPLSGNYLAYFEVKSEVTICISYSSNLDYYNVSLYKAIPFTNDVISKMC